MTAIRLINRISRIYLNHKVKEIRPLKVYEIFICTLLKKSKKFSKWNHILLISDKNHLATNNYQVVNKFAKISPVTSPLTAISNYNRVNFRIFFSKIVLRIQIVSKVIKMSFLSKMRAIKFQIISFLILQ